MDFPSRICTFVAQRTFRGNACSLSDPKHAKPIYRTHIVLTSGVAGYVHQLLGTSRLRFESISSETR